MSPNFKLGLHTTIHLAPPLPPSAVFPTHTLYLSLLINCSDRVVGTALGHRPRRGRRASSSHRRSRALSAPVALTADGHANQLFPVLPKIKLCEHVITKFLKDLKKITLFMDPS